MYYFSVQFIATISKYIKIIMKRKYYVIKINSSPNCVCILYLDLIAIIQFFIHLIGNGCGISMKLCMYYFILLYKPSCF